MLVPSRTRVSNRRAAGRRGRGVLNTLINKLPVELHLPGYKFCGPGTRLQKRLARGDRGVNPLDEACREHDIVYSTSDDLRTRHQADKVLAKKAWERVKAKDSRFSERAAALTVAGLMKGKTTVGMGTRKRRRSSRKRTTKAAKRVGGAIARKRVKKSASKKTNRKSRILTTPKRGGFLPLLLPLLGALGGLGGGAAAIAKAVGDSKSQAKALAEKQRHDREMETIARGKGLYLRPYRPKNYR